MSRVTLGRVSNHDLPDSRQMFYLLSNRSGPNIQLKILKTFFFKLNHLNYYLIDRKVVKGCSDNFWKLVYI